jgi:addiction module HigA family antidote
MKLRSQRRRPPSHPGEVLLEDFLKPKGMTQVALAAKIGVPLQRVNGLITGRRGVTAETAILLSREFGTTAEFWMMLQNARDIYFARKKLA